MCALALDYKGRVGHELNERADVLAVAGPQRCRRRGAHAAA